MPTFLSVTLPVEACEGIREDVMRAKEQAILTLGKTLAKNNRPEGEVFLVNVWKRISNSFMLQNWAC